MNLVNFATELVQALAREPLPADVDGEQDFKRRFLIPIAKGIDPLQQSVLIYSPPFRSTKCCDHPCRTKPPGGSGRVLGCPTCWHDMKVWGSVAAFGTHHTFDLVAQDDSQTLAVEAKLTAVSGGKMPNGELQRFLGQCALAATKHTFVIGLFGYRGQLKERHHGDTERARKWFESRHVEVVFRQVGQPARANSAARRPRPAQAPNPASDRDR